MSDSLPYCLKLLVKGLFLISAFRGFLFIKINVFNSEQHEDGDSKDDDGHRKVNPFLVTDVCSYLVDDVA